MLLEEKIKDGEEININCIDLNKFKKEMERI